MQESLSESVKSNSLQMKSMLVVMKSRAIYYRSRLYCISTSAAVELECPVVVGLCAKLITVLNTDDVEKDNLNGSIQDLSIIDTSQTKNILNENE